MNNEAVDTVWSNPLAVDQFEIPFDQIKPEHVDEAIATLIVRGQEDIARIVHVSGPRTFENTVLAFDQIGRTLVRAWEVVEHLEGVVRTDEWTSARERVEPAVTEFWTKLYLSKDLYVALKAYAATDEADQLRGERRRYLATVLDEFRRQGAALSKPEQERLAELNRELAELQSRFQVNVISAMGAWRYHTSSAEEVAGLPGGLRALAWEEAQRTGQEGWCFKLNAPTYTQILKLAQDRSLRERFYRAWNSRCLGGEYDNSPLIERILALRWEKANLLGYADWVDYQLENRMAKRGAAAAEFEATLVGPVQAAMEREMAELEQFYRERVDAEAPPLAPWDLSYYVEQLQAERFGFDSETLRPYFSLERALGKLFRYAEELYGIAITESQEQLPTWDERVRVFDVSDREGRMLGRFYGDFLPRDNKSSGAWCNMLIPAAKGGKFQQALGVLAANVMEPAAGMPILLSHNELKTLAHEFGHMLHVVLSQVELEGHSGYNAAWDFVELPSRLHEYLVWDRSLLEDLAEHWQTREQLSAALLDKVVEARNFFQGFFMAHQLAFGLADLELHRGHRGAPAEALLAAGRQVMNKLLPLPFAADLNSLPAFTHIFSGGYAAGYYSYLWADTLVAEAIGRFRAAGMLNPEVGEAFREHILSKGDSEDPLVLFNHFMERDPETPPQVEALLREQGLLLS